MHDRDVNRVVTRLRNEFIEMPGLRLTIPQAMRLWGLNHEECTEAVEKLIRDSFLKRTRKGDMICAK